MGLPLEAVYVDEKHMSNEINFQFNKDLVPDPKALKDQLR